MSYPDSTCKNCKFQVKRDFNCQVLVVPIASEHYYNLPMRPGQDNFSCAFFQYREDLLKGGQE